LGAGWRDPVPYCAKQCGAITLLTTGWSNQIKLSTPVNEIFIRRECPTLRLWSSNRKKLHMQISSLMLTSRIMAKLWYD
jgi:hypothetical protein